ncbi:MAG: hypothetical protein P8Z00_19430 [Anaerolineales bacterium]|jgi:hypothetical protein
MKTNLLITVASAAVLASSMASAATSSISDSDLAAISGKSNSAAFASTNIAVTLTSGNGDVQVGFYQWDDDHGGDSSQQKGGNSANGAASNVQNGVAALNNIFGWGAASQVNTTVGGNVSGTYATESWGTLYVGGF